MGLLMRPAPPEWARVGIRGAEARLWVLLGVAPEQARRLTSDGLDPADVVEQRWGAGVPLPEVASWLCAGLSAEEAVQQRAAGVTVDQARAFGALQGLPGAD